MPQTEKVLKIARTSIDEALRGNTKWLPVLDEDWMRANQGAFTTIYIQDSSEKRLRGCIGLPFPVQEAGKAVAISARKSALEDPRFPKLKLSELDRTVISVELLSDYTKLEWTSIEELKDQIELGTHGLRLKFKFSSDVHSNLV